MQQPAHAAVVQRMTRAQLEQIALVARLEPYADLASARIRRFFGNLQRTEEIQVIDLERPVLADLAQRRAGQLEIAGAREARLPLRRAVLVQEPDVLGPVAGAQGA